MYQGIDRQAKRADLIRRIKALAAQRAFYYDSPNREFLLQGLARIQRRQDRLFEELEKLDEEIANAKTPTLD